MFRKAANFLKWPPLTDKAEQHGGLLLGNGVNTRTWHQVHSKFTKLCFIYTHRVLLFIVFHLTESFTVAVN